MSKDRFPVLDHLQALIAGGRDAVPPIHLNYPTAISTTLGMRIKHVAAGEACVEIDADSRVHGNQQGTVHGGLIAELADAAIGTAHSTCMLEGESFASIELSVRFFRPVWKSVLRAVAKPVQFGKTIAHYSCKTYNDDEKLVALASSVVMTLRGENALGRMNSPREHDFDVYA